MAKNKHIDVRISELDYNNFLIQCGNLTITQFIEKISREQIIFLDKNAKKLIDIIMGKKPDNVYKEKTSKLNYGTQKDGKN